jgi:hypothetical protein
MSWDAIAALAELLSALGVLASLVYLGFQIRQNTGWLKQQAFQLGTNEVRRWASHFAESRATSELFIKGQRSYESLDRAEQFQFTMIVFEICSVWGTYQQYQSEDFLGLRESAEVSITTWIAQGWFRDWWKANEFMFPPVWRSFVVELLEKTPERPNAPRDSAL